MSRNIDKLASVFERFGDLRQNSVPAFLKDLDMRRCLAGMIHLLPSTFLKDVRLESPWDPSALIYASLKWLEIIYGAAKNAEFNRLPTDLITKDTVVGFCLSPLHMLLLTHATKEINSFLPVAPMLHLVPGSGAPCQFDSTIKGTTCTFDHSLPSLDSSALSQSS